VADAEYHEEFRIADLARLCQVRVTTVHAWIENGRVRDFERASERGPYLIPRHEVARILRERDVEVRGVWERPRLRVLVVGAGIGAAEILGIRIRKFVEVAIEVAETAVDAVVRASRKRPDLVFLAAPTLRDDLPLLQTMTIFSARHFRRTRVIGLCEDEREERQFRAAAVREILTPPITEASVEALLRRTARRFMRKKRKTNP
jgi:hypothetical protein